MVRSTIKTLLWDGRLFAFFRILNKTYFCKRPDSSWDFIVDQDKPGNSSINLGSFDDVCSGAIIKCIYNLFASFKEGSFRVFYRVTTFNCNLIKAVDIVVVVLCIKCFHLFSLKTTQQSGSSLVIQWGTSPVWNILFEIHRMGDFISDSKSHPTRQLRSTEHVDKMAKRQNGYMTKWPCSKT